MPTEHILAGLSGPDHDLLVELKVLAQITAKEIGDIKQSHMSAVTALDTRIRQLENFRYWILGAAAAAGAAASQAVQKMFPIH